jgi:hypothetical protein
MGLTGFRRLEPDPSPRLPPHKMRKRDGRWLLAHRQADALGGSRDGPVEPVCLVLLQPLPSSDAACRAWLPNAACPASSCPPESPREASSHRGPSPHLAPEEARPRGPAAFHRADLALTRSDTLVPKSGWAFAPWPPPDLRSRAGDDVLRLGFAPRLGGSSASFWRPGPPPSRGSRRERAEGARSTSPRGGPSGANRSDGWSSHVGVERCRPRSIPTDVCNSRFVFQSWMPDVSAHSTPLPRGEWDARIHAGTSLRRAGSPRPGVSSRRFLRSVPLIPRRHAARRLLPEGIAA